MTRKKKEGKPAPQDRKYTLRELREMYTYEKGYNLSDLDLDNIRTGTYTKYESVSKIRGVYPNYERDEYNTPLMDEYKWYVEVEPGIFTVNREIRIIPKQAYKKIIPSKKVIWLLLKSNTGICDDFTYKILEVSDLRAEIVPIDSKLPIPPINVVNINEIEKKNR